MLGLLASLTFCDLLRLLVLGSFPTFGLGLETFTAFSLILGALDCARRMFSVGVVDLALRQAIDRLVKILSFLRFSIHVDFKPFAPPHRFLEPLHIAVEEALIRLTCGFWKRPLREELKVSFPLLRLIDVSIGTGPKTSEAGL